MGLAFTVSGEVGDARLMERRSLSGELEGGGGMLSRKSVHLQMSSPSSSSSCSKLDNISFTFVSATEVEGGSGFWSWRRIKEQREQVCAGGRARGLMLGLVRGTMVVNSLSGGGEGESRKPDRRSMEEQGGEGGFVLKVNLDGAGLVSIDLLI